MPYIKKEDRKDFDSLVNALVDLVHEKSISTCSPECGNLNYIITTLLNKTYNYDICPRYADYNEMVGVLECAKLELYRRTAAPYEDVKINENGDVYVKYVKKE